MLKAQGFCLLCFWVKIRDRTSEAKHHRWVCGPWWPHRINMPYSLQFEPCSELCTANEGQYTKYITLCHWPYCTLQCNISKPFIMYALLCFQTLWLLCRKRTDNNNILIEILVKFSMRSQKKSIGFWGIQSIGNIWLYSSVHPPIPLTILNTFYVFSTVLASAKWCKINTTFPELIS